METNKNISPLRKLAIKITLIISFFSPSLMAILIFFIPKPLRETFLYAIFAIVMENVLLLTILYFQSKLINLVAYPGLFIIGVIGTGLVTNNNSIVGLSSFLALILTPTIFLITPLLIILLGVKSIKDKESIIKVPGMSVGNRLQNVQGPEAVGWGFIYIYIGLIFLLMVVSGLMYASCGNSSSGLCVLNQPIEKTFVFSTKVLGKNSKLTLTMLAALISGLYSLFKGVQKIKKND